MGTRAVRGAETANTRTAQGAFAPARTASAWAVALLAGAVVLLLLARVQPMPVETLMPAGLATQRDMAGFYAPERDALGNTYVWADREATAAFDLASRKPLTLVLDLRSAATVGGPDTPVSVRVNGREIGTVRPDPARYDFAQFRLRVPRSDTPLLRVALVSAAAIAPRPDDGRTLAVMVRSVSLDRSEAWSTIARRAWLYGVAPLALLLAAVGVAGSRVLTGRGITSRLMGYAAVLAAGAGAAAMLAATALLLSIGEIDRSAYYLWLLGSAYLAALCGAVALALPFGAAGAPSLWRRAASAAFVRRNAPRLRLAAGVAALAGVLLLAVGLFTYYGTGDVDRKLKWMNNVRAYGLVDAYATIPDQYPPLTLAILAAADRTGDTLRLSDFAALKGSLLLFVALTAAMLLWMTRDALLTAATTLALLPNAMALGYTDIYFAPPLVGALWALRGRQWAAFSLCLALACLVKWQAAILAPPLLLAAVRMAGEPHPPAPSPSSGEGVTHGKIAAYYKRLYLPAFAPSLRRAERRVSSGRMGGEVVPRLAALLLPGAALAGIALLVFGFPVLASLVKGMGERFLSANALNANWLLTQLLHTFAPAAWPGRGTIQSTDPALTLPPKLLFAAAYAFALSRLARGTPTFVRAVGWSLAGYLAYFALNTGVHENHLFPAIILAAVLAAETGDRSGRVAFALVALGANLNLVLFYGLRGEPLTPPALGPLDLAVILSALNVALIAAFVAWRVRAERHAA